MIKASKLKRYSTYILSMLLITAVFVAMLSPLIFSADDIQQFVPINVGYFIMLIGMMLITILSLISSIGFTYSIGYLDKNLDNYIYMPIKSRDFVIAKFLIIYSSVILISALGMLPCLISSIAFAGFDLTMIFAAIFFTITIPLITTYVALVLVGTVMIFLNKLKNKTVARNIIYFIFIMLMMSFSFSISFFTSSMNENTDPQQIYSALNNTLSVVKTILFYPTWASEIFTSDNFINILYMIATCIVGAITLLYYEKIYYKGAIGFSNDYYKSKGKKFSKKQLKNRGVKSWMFYIEAKQLLKTSAYFFNTILGNIIIVVLYLGMMAYAYFTADQQALTEIKDLIQYVDIYTVYLVAICISAFFTLFSTGAATAYSREAYNLEAYKSMPIDMKSAFLGKVYFHFLLEIITAIVFMALPMLVIGLNIKYILIMIIAVFLVTCAFIFLPFVADLRFPSLKWESDVMVVKRSKSVPITMITSLIFAGIIITLTIVLSLVIEIDTKIVCAILTFILIAMFALLYWAYTKLIRKAF